MGDPIRAPVGQVQRPTPEIHFHPHPDPHPRAGEVPGEMFTSFRRRFSSNSKDFNRFKLMLHCGLHVRVGCVVASVLIRTATSNLMANLSNLRWAWIPRMLTAPPTCAYLPANSFQPSFRERPFGPWRARKFLLVLILESSRTRNGPSAQLIMLVIEGSNLITICSFPSLRGGRWKVLRVCSAAGRGIRGVRRGPENRAQLGGGRECPEACGG